jgi:hypothetical protein
MQLKFVDIPNGFAAFRLLPFVVPRQFPSRNSDQVRRVGIHCGLGVRVLRLVRERWGPS